MDLESLRKKAKEIAGREVGAQLLPDGQYIVEWFSFQHAPPPPAKTEKEAYQGFIKYMGTLKEGGNETEDDRA